jgi:glutathione S-transferase
MYRLHCYSGSGNCFKVAMMLNAIAEPWTPVFVDYMSGATREPQWRRDLNELGEIPILEDGDLLLTQSGLILHYLADKHGQYGGTHAHDKREILRWLFFDNHKFTGALASYRFLKSFAPTKADPAVLAWLKARVDRNFALVEHHLARSAFIAGDELTIADFSMAGYLFYPSEETGYVFAESHPNIAGWVSRIGALPGWTAPYDVMPGDPLTPIH